MAIIIRHSTLSEKTQSAISGIISKNEWNDRHVIEGGVINESEILFDPNSGHNHDGTGSKVADKAIRIKDGSTSNYRYASSKATIDEIPILASDGFLNIKRSGTLQYAGIRIYDTNGTSIKGYFTHDFTQTKMTMYNLTGLNYIDLADNGDIGITPRSGWSVINVTDNVIIRTSNVAQPAPAGHNSQIAFSNSVGSPRGYLIYKHCTSDDYDGLWLYNSVGSNVIVNRSGNVVLNAVGVSGKAYYNKTGNVFPPAAGREIVVKDDISGFRLSSAIAALQYFGSSGVCPNDQSWSSGWIMIPQIGFIYGLVIRIGQGWQGAGSSIAVQQYFGAGAGWSTITGMWGTGGDGSTYSNISPGVANTNVSVGNSSSWPVQWLTIPGPILSNGSNLRFIMSINHPGNTYWQYGYNLLSW